MDSGGSCEHSHTFQVPVWREFDTRRVNLDPPIMCADWPVAGNLTLFQTQTIGKLKPWDRADWKQLNIDHDKNVKTISQTSL